MINTVAISYTKEHVLTGSNDKIIKLWNINNYSCIHTFKEHLSRIVFVSFCADDKCFISYSEDGIIKLWQINSANCIDTYQLSLKESDLVSWFFPYFIIHNNGICSVYRIEYSAENGKLAICIVGKIYNA